MTTASWGGGRGIVLGLCVTIVGIGTKSLLLTTGAPTGFAACYTTPLSAPQAGPCERLDASPFSGGRLSRRGEAIVFRWGTWPHGSGPGDPCRRALAL